MEESRCHEGYGSSNSLREERTLALWCGLGGRALLLLEQILGLCRFLLARRGR